MKQLKQMDKSFHNFSSSIKKVLGEDKWRLEHGHMCQLSVSLSTLWRVTAIMDGQLGRGQCS